MDNPKDKSLITVNESSIFYKIKMFFSKIFKRNEDIKPNYQVENTKINYNAETKEDFNERIKVSESEETKLLELQKRFDNYEIDKSQLSQEQVSKLIELYQKQINNLKKSNEYRIKKIKKFKEEKFSKV